MLNIIRQWFWFVPYLVIVLIVITISLMYSNEYIVEEKWDYDVRHSAIAVYSSYQNVAQYSPSGSGFYIGDGLFVTNKHVTDNILGDFVAISTYRGKSYFSTLVFEDIFADVAILKVEAIQQNELVPLRMICDNPRYGSEVRAIGNPIGQYFYSAWGRVAGTDVYLKGLGRTNIYVLDMPILYGMSGGPVVDVNNRVVGQIFAVLEKRVMIYPPVARGSTSAGFGYMTSSKEICAVINRYKQSLKE